VSLNISANKRYQKEKYVTAKDTWISYTIRTKYPFLLLANQVFVYFRCGRINVVAELSRAVR